MAEQWTLNLIRKFKKDEVFATEYKGFMDEVIKKGYAEKVPQEQLRRNDGRLWYIPHHGVYHKCKGSIRVVFDCASSFKGTSLNNELLQGPDLANKLIGVLLRFRQENIAIMELGPPGTCAGERRGLPALPVVTRGWLQLRIGGVQNDSPSLWVCILTKLCKLCNTKDRRRNCQKYDKEVTDNVLYTFYVDDCLKSVSTEQQAIALARDLRDLCSQGGFKLTKWVSNSRAV